LTWREISGHRVSGVEGTSNWSHKSRGREIGISDFGGLNSEGLVPRLAKSDKAKVPISKGKVSVDLSHEPDSDHRPLALTLNFVMHKISIEENYDNQRHLLFDKNKVDLFLKHLNSELNLLSYKNNIEDLYHNFMTTLSTSINKFSIEVLCKKKNRTTNPWYDNECKIARKSIRDASNESLKYDKIKRYKALIKRKKKTLHK
jgi:hypothetical protein